MISHLEQSQEKEKLQQILLNHKIVVCCGAGGVGKTTTAATLGIAACLLGKKVLVLTIDPARRLADALGVSLLNNLPHRVELPAELQEKENIGTMDIWMLHPQPVFDEMVERLSTSPQQAQNIQKSHLYQPIRNLISGMQEYMAGESLFQFYSEHQYDLLILDTPPSRNTIDFFKAPDQILRFFDSSILKVFSPSKSRFGFFDQARKLVTKVFEQVAGGTFLGNIQEFFAIFIDLIDVLKEHAEKVRAILASKETSNILVTSPDPYAFQEALYFQSILKERNIPFGGFILNRSLADRPENTFQENEAFLHSPANALLQSQLEKLQPLAKLEQRKMQEHQKLMTALQEKAQGKAFTIASPHLGRDIEDVTGLIQLAQILMNENKD